MFVTHLKNLLQLAGLVYEVLGDGGAYVLVLVEGHFGLKFFVQFDVLLYGYVYYLLNFILNVKGLVLEKFQYGEARPFVHLQQLINRNWAAILHVKDVGVWDRFIMGVTEL